MSHRNLVRLAAQIRDAAQLITTSLRERGAHDAAARSRNIEAEAARLVQELQALLEAPPMPQPIREVIAAELRTLESENPPAE